MTLVKVNNNLGRSLDGMLKEIFNEFPSSVSKTFREDAVNFHPVNIAEKTASYQIELAAPGFNKADFNIKLDGNILNISTVPSEEKKELTDKIIRREFTRKAVDRNFTIDNKIDAENITATYENGILTILLSKKEIVNSGAKTISIV